MIRKRIALAGPGALNRKVCHNEEDMVTSEEKQKVSPLEYFGLKEGDKLWWFEQKTIIQWAHQNAVVTNPFTRTPLQQEDLRRIRQLYTFRLRNKLPIWHTTSPMTLEEKQELRWRRVVQLMTECGFDDISLTHWSILSFSQIMLIANILAEDLRWWVYQTSSRKNAITRRFKVWSWMNHFCKVLPGYTSAQSASTDLAGLMNSIAAEFSEDPTEFAFFYMSAYYKCMLVAN